jgi:hypothetical protein
VGSSSIFGGAKPVDTLKKAQSQHKIIAFMADLGVFLDQSQCFRFAFIMCCGPLYSILDLGWGDFEEKKKILNKSVHGIYSFLCKYRYRRHAKKTFDVTIGLKKGHDLLVWYRT